MADINDTFTKNKFIDKVMKLIPEDALTQSKFLYYLTTIVFIGLLGYGLTSWYMFFTTIQLKYLFSALFMTAIACISLFGLKQTRASYIMTRQLMSSAYSQKPKTMSVESKKEMLELFNGKN